MLRFTKKHTLKYKIAFKREFSKAKLFVPSSLLKKRFRPTHSLVNDSLYPLNKSFHFINS